MTGSKPQTIRSDHRPTGAEEPSSSRPRQAIVIVDSSVAVTGGLRAAARTARLLAPWVDTIIALPENAEIPAAELADFVEVVRLPVRQIRKSVRDLVLFVPALLQSGWRLRRLLDRTAASTLIVNDFNQMQGVAARGFGYKGRLVTFVRCDPRKFPEALARLWLGAAYRVSDHVVAVSHYVAGRIPPTPKLRAIYDVLDLDLPMGEHARPRAGARDVVQIANYIADKGQGTVLDAFLRIAPRHPDARLIFYGGDMGLEKNRAFRKSLEERAAQSGFGERILFRGFANDITAALETAVVVCNLSISEALSFTCIEASQLGIPVVAFRSGGPGEIIIDGVTGYLCGLGDVECAALRVDQLLSDPGRATEMGKAAVEHVRTTFGAETFVAEMRNILAI